MTGMDRNLSTCAYYRGVGTCSFSCLGSDGPLCHELGRPTSADVANWERLDLPYAEFTGPSEVESRGSDVGE